MKLKICLLFFVLCLCSCKKTFKDDELSLQREFYDGNAIRLDGYYYYHGKNSTSVFFLYRNGVVLKGMSFEGVNLDVIEKTMIEYYDIIRKRKYHWGVYIIRENILEVESWGSVGWTRTLPIFKSFYNIVNDTTLNLIKEVNLSDGRETEYNDIYHFRQFYPKPDSTNNFIK